MLRENIFGGADNMNQYDKRFNQGRPSHYLGRHHPHNFEPPLWNDVSNQQMLELAIQEQNSRVQQQKEQQRARMRTDWEQQR